VISGFIITYVAEKYNGRYQGLYFLAKRFCRINPVYYIATLFYVFEYFLSQSIAHQSIQSSLKEIGPKASDSLLIFPTSDIVDSFSPLLVVGWTLAFEWLFYILFFSSIVCNVKRKGMFLLSIIGCLVLIGRVSHFDDLRMIFLTNPILLEFLLGVIICNCYLHMKRIPTLAGEILLTVGIIGYLLLIIFGFGYVWHYQLILSGEQSLNRFLYWGIPSSFIVAGSVILEKNGKLTTIWSNKISLLIGNASFSIYLIHTTVLYLLTLLYIKTGFFTHADVMIWFQIIVAVAISIAFYKLVENPLLLFMNRSNIWTNWFPPKVKVTKKSTELFEPVSASVIN